MQIAFRHAYLRKFHEHPYFSFPRQGLGDFYLVVTPPDTEGSPSMGCLEIRPPRQIALVVHPVIIVFTEGSPLAS